MLRRSARHLSAAPAAGGALLGYAITPTAADEMLYGGVRVTHLVRPPFALKRTRSEDLPPLSAGAAVTERRDLGVEMGDPTAVSNYDRVHMSVARQVDADGRNVYFPEGWNFNLREYFSALHHPERHHNSSLPAPPDAAHGNSNNVLALRLFPVNINIKDRLEAVRIRTADCLARLRSERLCMQSGRRVVYPLPEAAQAHLREQQERQRQQQRQKHGARHAARDLAYLRGGPSHPPASELSIFTRPCDLRFGQETGAEKAGAAAARAFKPLQMIKPMGGNWSPSLRSSGTTGRSAQLHQERLDNKGFGWKRKSRSLWQQDVDTAGFRPHRYF